MMQQSRRYVLLPIACVLLVFCAVRAVRKPAASEGAQRIALSESRAQADEKETPAPLRTAMESTPELDIETADEWPRQLETAREAQRLKHQEAAH
ncbi:MAG: hypothetical protein MUC88_06360, partial [Planctomycetes bacterium]|nr:hypothetical protein [Planctomycetota bacterium]